METDSVSLWVSNRSIKKHFQKIKEKQQQMESVPLLDHMQTFTKKKNFFSSFFSMENKKQKIYIHNEFSFHLQWNCTIYRTTPPGIIYLSLFTSDLVRIVNVFIYLFFSLFHSLSLSLCPSHFFSFAFSNSSPLRTISLWWQQRNKNFFSVVRNK